MRLEQYILNDETQLSPAVVVTTILLVNFFAIEILYQVIGILLW